jgi:hypothetical protein
MVYQGISQPIFAFRRAMSACDAREAKTKVVSRMRPREAGFCDRAR